MSYTEKQLQIMEKALELFAESGYDRTSVRDIAKHADINIAMISYYFGSKEKLLEAIFDHHGRNTRAELGKIIRRKYTTELDRLRDLTDFVFDMVLLNKNFHILMVRESVSLKEGPLYNMITDLKKRNKQVIRLAINKGQKEGMFKKNLNVSILTTILIGSANQAIANRQFLCLSHQIDRDDDKAFKQVVMEELKQVLKIMFTTYLTQETRLEESSHTGQQIS